MKKVEKYNNREHDFLSVNKKTYLLYLPYGRERFSASYTIVGKAMLAISAS